MDKTLDNTTLLPDPLTEEEDIVILLVPKMEIEEAFPEIFRAKMLLRREKVNKLL